MTHPALKDDLSDIHKSIDVPLAPDQAFDLFTHGIATWWPGDTHSISAKDDQSPQDLTIEPQEGGQIWDAHRGLASPNGPLPSDSRSIGTLAAPKTRPRSLPLPLAASTQGPAWI
jgi:hypothetical protein